MNCETVVHSNDTKFNWILYHLLKICCSSYFLSTCIVLVWFSLDFISFLIRCMFLFLEMFPGCTGQCAAVLWTPLKFGQEAPRSKKEEIRQRTAIMDILDIGIFLSFGKGSKKWIYDLCRNLWIFISIRNKIFLGDGFNRVSIIVVVVFAFNCIYSIPTFVIVFVCKLSFYL